MAKKVLVAMSGGVDSSVAAYLLKQAGYDVAGITMCLGVVDIDTDNKIRCCGVDAIDDAKKVCDQLDIAHYVLDFSVDMEKHVIANFISEYTAGHTPNPCVRCNEYLKFGRLFEYALKSGFDCMATGHYADIEESGGKFFLRRPKDREKDQTYFLYPIRKEALSRIIFPLSGYKKNQVRRIARDAKLVIADKPQSQDICFVSNGNYKDFVLKRTGAEKHGDIVDLDGVVLGRHTGIINYTLGQRQGLRIAARRPLYVVALDGDSNRVIVGGKKDLLAEGFVADNVNLLVGKIPEKVLVKIRYRKTEVPCRVEECGSGVIKGIFDHPQEAVTPGQSAVFYCNDVVLGGGVIKECIREHN